MIKLDDPTDRPSSSGAADIDRSVASGRTMDEIAHVVAPAAAVTAATRDPPRRPPPLRRTSLRAPRSAFIRPQLCVEAKRPPKGSAWVHDLKLDGYRLQVRIADGVATVWTRQGLDW
ncbi:MAG: hypothetical protein HC834_05510, partial [Rhodospirillales bacterium]|nr:hypothetical protein [Rhodospirillales bacterium]